MLFGYYFICCLDYFKAFSYWENNVSNIYKISLHNYTLRILVIYIYTYAHILFTYDSFAFIICR